MNAEVVWNNSSLKKKKTWWVRAERCISELVCLHNLYSPLLFCLWTLHQMYQTTGMQTLSHRNTLWVNRTRAWAVFNWATFYGGKWEKLLVKLYISTALRRETYFRSHSVILGWGGQNPRDTQLMIMSLQRPERICFFLAFFFYLVWTRCAYFSTYFSNVFHFYTAHSTFTHRNAIIANL